jgi:hypothetical protein
MPLNQYIKDAQEHGLSDAQIREELLKAGWDPSAVDSALNQAAAERSGFGQPSEPAPAAAAPATAAAAASGQSASAFSDPAVQACLSKRKKRFLIGLAVMIVPSILIPVAMFMLVSGDPETYGKFGSLGSLGNLVFYIIGAVIMVKRDPCPNVTFDPRSGQGKGSPVPPEIKRWNWGAFLLSWIWGPANRVSYFIWMIIPLVNIYIWIMLGLKGNEMAWQEDTWVSAEHFHQVQRRWAKWGIIVTAISALLPLIGYFIMMSIMTSMMAGM